jgi:hypothetical protein
VNEQNPQYKPGDIANGHVLTESGQWLPVGGPPPPVEPMGKKPIYKRWWVIALAAVFVISGISSAMGDESDPADASANSNPVASTQTKEEPKAKDKAKEKATEDATEEAEPAPAPEPKAVAVSAKQILAEFEGNEAAADLKYKGKTLRVTGVVDKVDTEFWDEEEYTIQLSDGSEWAFWTVNCNDVTGATAAQVKVGSTVSVLGEFDDGGDLGVEIKSCTVA